MYRREGEIKKTEIFFFFKFEVDNGPQLETEQTTWVIFCYQRFSLERVVVVDVRMYASLPLYNFFL